MCNALFTPCNICHNSMFALMLYCTSSNFSAIMENALKMPSVGPVMVTILSGDDPSDMLMRAPLWKHKSIIIPTLHFARNVCPNTWFPWVSSTRDVQVNAHLLPHFLHCFSFLDSWRKPWNKRVGLISYSKGVGGTHNEHSVKQGTGIPCQLCCQLPVIQR